MFKYFKLYTLLYLIVVGTGRAVCRFLYLYNPCDVRNKAVFLILELNRKNTRKQSKTAKQLSANSRKKFIFQYQASRRVTIKHWAPAVFLFEIFRYFPAFYVAILVEYPVLFILGKCLMVS